MSASVVALIDPRLTVIETLDADPSIAQSPTKLQHVIEDLLRLTSGTDIPVSKVWSKSLTMTGSVVALDLTALPRTQSLRDVNFNGLKLQAFKFVAPTENAGAISISFGAANPYDLFGDPDAFVKVQPGGSLLMVGAEGLPDVSGTAKQIDVEGTLGDVLKCILLAG